MATPTNTTYTVYYDANGGVGGPGSSVKIQSVDLRLPSFGPYREDYEFIGWATSATAGKAEYEIGAVYTLDADVVLYAVWRPVASVYIRSTGKQLRGRIWGHKQGVWFTGIPWIKSAGKWLQGGGNNSADSRLIVIVEENAAGGFTYTITATNHEVIENMSGGLTHTIGG